MTLLRHSLHWSPQVMTCSALEGMNIDAVWSMILDYREQAHAKDAFQSKRNRQARDWMHQLVNEMLQLRLSGNAAARALLPELEAQVVAREITPYTAACRIMDCL